MILFTIEIDMVFLPVLSVYSKNTNEECRLMFFTFHFVLHYALNYNLRKEPNLHD
jgi:NADH:ubiquinone oxidoreductase subunit 3 (subunit A)